MDRIWKNSLLLVVIVLLDQLTKAATQSNFSYGESYPLIEGFFSLTHVRNTGGAFGLLAGSGRLLRVSLFLLLPVGACFWLIRLIWIQRKAKSPLAGLTYTLILSGAIGNLIDRFFYGYVVDFLDFYWGSTHFPAFNIADSAITVGGVGLFLDFYLQWSREKRTSG